MPRQSEGIACHPTWTHLLARLNEIIPYGPVRDKMLESLARVKANLRSSDPGDLRHPAERAADAVLALLPREKYPR